MPGNANAEVLRRAYAAWHDTKGDASVWFDLMADTIVMGSLANGAQGLDFSKTRMSREEALGYFEDLARDWTMVHYKMNEFIADGDRVVALGECCWTHRHTGKIVTTPKADVWRFKDGKAVDFYEYYDTHQALCACS